MLLLLLLLFFKIMNRSSRLRYSISVKSLSGRRRWERISSPLVATSEGLILQIWKRNYFDWDCFTFELHEVKLSLSSWQLLS
jgi:hypothetical protein